MGWRGVDGRDYVYVYVCVWILALSGVGGRENGSLLDGRIDGWGGMNIECKAVVYFKCKTRIPYFIHHLMFLHHHLPELHVQSSTSKRHKPNTHFFANPLLHC